MRWMGALGLALSLVGCGYTVGDSCTTDGDCGKGLCLNQSDTPGGYCSLVCTSTEPGGGKCPNGSVCVPKGADPTAGAARRDACFKKCQSTGDCRDGYACARFDPTSPTTVCMGI